MVVNGGVGYLVRESSRAYGRALQARFLAHGITLPQFFYLRVLWADDGISQATLGARVGADRGTISFVLTTMERQGMVVRRPDPHDLRKTNIFLTREGKRLRSPLLRIANAVNAAATRSMLPSDVERFKALLRKTTENLAGEGS